MLVSALDCLQVLILFSCREHVGCDLTAATGKDLCHFIKIQVSHVGIRDDADLFLLSAQRGDLLCKGVKRIFQYDIINGLPVEMDRDPVYMFCDHKANLLFIAVHHDGCPPLFRKISWLAKPEFADAADR